MAVNINNTFVNLKIGSLNCRGLNDHNKRQLLFSKFKQSDCTIICLQETKLHPEDESTYVNEWDNGPSFFNSVSGGRSGTAILVNTRQANIKSFFSDQDGRVICVDIEIGGVVLHIINTYFPNIDAEQYRLLHNLHPFFHSSHPIIWAGDHNISTNNEIDRLPPKNNKDRHGDSILEIISNFDLVDTCRAVYPNETNLFTYTQGLSKSRIDKIIVQREFKVVKYQQEMIYHSDHELLISQIQLNDDFERGKGVWKNNSLLYQNQYFLDEFKLLWNAWRRTSGVHCPVRRWVQLKNHVKSFLIDVGKKYAYQKKQKKKNDYDQLNYYLNCARCNVGSQRVNFMKQYSELKKNISQS